MSIESVLQQAGVWGLPFSWGDDGSVFFDDSIPEGQQSAIRNLILDYLPRLAKDRVGESIATERDRRMDQGGFKVGDIWFHSDQKSRAQQLGLALLGPNLPGDLQWKTMGGSFVAMTPELAQQILSAATLNDLAIFNAAEAHRAAMEGSIDPGAYDFSTGWPPVFGE